MKRHGTLGGVVCAIALCGGAPSCAAVLGVEDPILDEPLVPAVEAGVPETAADIGQPAEDAAADVPLADVPSTCATETTDEAHGIFVSLGGVAAADCGSKVRPCSKLQLGVDRAKIVPDVSTVYVDTGTYDETLRLPGGITVQGGWDWDSVGRIWRRQCSPTRAANVKIVGVDGYGVRAELTGALAVLDTLTIEVSVATGGGIGQSLYGVYAVGTTTSLNLLDVTVAVGGGGPGAVGVAGADGTNSMARCFGTTGSTGSVGTAGTPGGLGTFGPTGYTPRPAGPPSGSSAGAAGSHGFGTLGGSPSSNTASQCVEVCGAPDPGNNCNNGTTPNVYYSAGSISSQPGLGGCGGQAGGGGSGGGGGGAAIAVFAWDSQVMMSGGAARAGNGGPGGVGGAGGRGALGSTGIKGNDAMCTTACTFNGQSASCDKNGTPASFPGGAAGSRGGTGGQGGQGGGGAGGYSYSTFQGPTAMVTLDRTVLTHGTAGTGSGGAPTGKAADKGTGP